MFDRGTRGWFLRKVVPGHGGGGGVLETTSRNQGSELSSSTMIPQMTAVHLTLTQMPTAVGDTSPSSAARMIMDVRYGNALLGT